MAAAGGPLRASNSTEPDGPEQRRVAKRSVRRPHLRWPAQVGVHPAGSLEFLQTLNAEVARARELGKRETVSEVGLVQLLYSVGDDPPWFEARHHKPNLRAVGLIRALGVAAPIRC